MKITNILFLLGAALLAGCGSNSAPIHLCDELAANPLDPRKMAAGVEFDRMQPISAIRACIDALNDHPNEVRFQYQAARALKKAEDYRQAVEWYQKAADQGYAAAEFIIGFMYYQGNEFMYYPGSGVRKDLTQAAKWYRRAADQGYVPAQYALGNLYWNGLGAEPDFPRAARWYRKAADQGYADAQHALGNSYQYGRGVKQDFTQAAKWYRKAADQGHPEAARNHNAIQNRGVARQESTIRSNPSGDIMSQQIYNLADQLRRAGSPACNMFAGQLDSIANNGQPARIRERLADKILDGAYRARCL